MRWFSQHPAPEAGSLEGFRADGLELQMPLPKDFDSSETRKEVLATPLQQMKDLRPELRSHLVVLTQSVPPALRRYTTPSYYAEATLHGVTYTFDWHRSQFYEFSRLGFIYPTVFLTCRGVYSPAL